MDELTRTDQQGSATVGGAAGADEAAAILRRPGVLAVLAALRAAGIAGEPRVLPETAPSAAAAAQQLGCPVGAIANSLVFEADGEPLLVLTSGAHRVATERLAERIGVGRIRRASADFVRAATGQAIGGVAPLGHPRPLRTLVDESLADYPVIWAAAGHHRTVFPTRYEELAAATSAQIVPVD